jgi:hypothetical protein
VLEDNDCYIRTMKTRCSCIALCNYQSSHVANAPYWPPIL